VAPDTPPVASGPREVLRSQESPRLVQLAFRHLPSRSESIQAAMPHPPQLLRPPARNDIDRHSIATSQFWRSSALALPGVAQGPARGLLSQYACSCAEVHSYAAPARSVRLSLRASSFRAGGGTIKTGTVALRRTASATRSNGRAPRSARSCIGIAMKSASVSRAVSRISCDAGVPQRT